MDRTTLDAFLKDEYLFLQKTYEDFDQRALLIKSWSVTVSLGGLVLGFQYGKPALWVLAGIAAIAFWMLEAMWKTFQYSFSVRIKEIEAHFRGEESEPQTVPCQIYVSWFKAYQTGAFFRRLSEAALLPLVFVPHLILVILAAALLLLHFVFSVKLV